MVTYLANTDRRRTLPSPANLSKMPKKGKQQAPQQESSPSLQEEETGDVPPEVPDDTDVPDVEVVKVQPVAGLSRKRTRPSKKDVQDYPFNDDQLREIANYVQLHPELYDKRNEKWLNPAWKESLWKGPGPNFLGLFSPAGEEGGGQEENRFWENREEGEQEWISSQAEDAEGAEDRRGLGLPGRSHRPRKRKRKKERQEEELSSPRSTKSTQESSAIQELLQSAQLLATRKPPVEGPDADIRQFVEFMYTRLKKVSPMHHGVLFSKIAYMISLMEEPVMARSAIKDPRRLLDSVPMPLGVASPSHLWQPPAPPTLAPAPPPPPPPVYHQPQYQQPHYSQPQYQQQQYQQPQQQYQPQQSEQQQFPQQPQQQQVPTPIQWESILGCSPSPVKTLQHTSTTTKLQGQKTKSPAKKAIMSPMIETPKGYEAEDSDE
ncbi:serine/arginine repetitive matrix protein 1-like [Scylla paramamosain]|uniref:serine/arginine repetitive matrix protein 1-like n=1 Tax=Scylla paramamosain TaxID=85552 RepID=UPI003083B508